ncbi:MFS transporter [Romboutsia sp.]|uniref:MFS transporter n=1 Tax=Romboutsia sp. TaxID=1965302 RepID=UPI003F2F48CD
MSKVNVTYNRAKLWQIGLFALNNTATNIAMVLMGYLAFFGQNVLGLMAAVIGVVITGMRIFDGFTDPVIGYFIDRTEGKFGKFRPFMLVGNIIIVASMYLIFAVAPTLEQSIRFPMLMLFYVIYVIGYTFQTACTKAAQAVLTNDPKQRPMFSMFDGIYNAILFAVAGLVITSILPPKFELGMLDPGLWKQVAILFGGLSFTLTILAIIGIWDKDKKENFGTGDSSEPIKVKEYLPIIKNNRAIQMLVIAASTDKLAMQLTNATQIYFYGNVLLNVSLQGEIGAITTPLVIALTFIGVMYARKMGQKKAFILGTWASMAMLFALLIIQPFDNISLTSMNGTTILLMTLILLQKGFASVSGNMVIPMIADCADYEVYRSGKFIPGMMGTLFSFVDKLISSFASTLLGVGLAMIGLGNAIIEPGTSATGSFFLLIMVCMFIIPILGHAASIIAMKYYPLDEAKMAEIQDEIQKIKNEQAIA